MQISANFFQNQKSHQAKTLCKQINKLKIGSWQKYSVGLDDTTKIKMKGERAAAKA